MTRVKYNAINKKIVAKRVHKKVIQSFVLLKTAKWWPVSGNKKMQQPYKWKDCTPTIKSGK